MGLFYFAVIPVSLVAIFLSYNSMEHLLVLNIHNPTLLSMIGANYYHSSFNHLAGNLALYFIVMVFVFAFDAMTNRKMLLINIPLLFLILPMLCSSLMVLTFGSLEYNISSNGFSGIVSGLFGYLYYSLFHFIQDYFKVRFARRTFNLMGIILLINLALISLIYQFLLILPFIIAILAIGIYYTRTDFGRIFSLMNKCGPIPRAALLVSFMLCLCMGTQFLFPEVIVTGNNIVNIFIHYTGFLFGFAVPAVVSICYIQRSETPE